MSITSMRRHYLSRPTWRQPHVGFNVATYSVYELDKVMMDMPRAPSLGVDGV